MTGMRPMLATAGPVPEGPGWAYEFAWDGARTLAEVAPDQVRMVGGERGLAASYPELDVLRSVGPAVLDGAVVALDAFGRPSLPRLRRRTAVQHPSAAMLRRLPVSYYVFDLLRLGDRDTTNLPYQQRRRMLEDLPLPGGAVALAPAFDADGQAVLDTAAQYGLHGIVAKRGRSRYQPGRRTRSWVETALRRTQEVVIGGWVPGRGGTLASLLVGVPSERGLHYAGRVTGFAEATRQELTERLRELTTTDSPFAGRGAPTGARWLAPELLAEVSYRRWTTDGRLERPTWGRLRPERHPAAVQSPLVLKAPGEDTDEDLAEAVRKARAEVDALKAQISPHFLYNVLNMVSSYVRIDSDLARELLADFAGFARYAFRTGVELSTVADELENVERYLNLQRARFGERLRVELQVAPAVLAVPVPFLAMQLAVEHAVQHSIELKPGGGTLTISAVPSGADCLVTITDDGAGSEPGPTLRTLDDRLRSTYGERRGLIIDRPGGGGTRLSFLAPLSR